MEAPNNNNDSHKEILLFSLPEEVGALAQALAIFKVWWKEMPFNVNGDRGYLTFERSWQDHKVNMLHIESRSSKRSPGDYEFIVEVDREKGDVAGACEELRKKSAYFQIISRTPSSDSKGYNALSSADVAIT